jgi:hypothetical protein
MRPLLKLDNLNMESGNDQAKHFTSQCQELSAQGGKLGCDVPSCTPEVHRYTQYFALNLKGQMDFVFYSLQPSINLCSVMISLLLMAFVLLPLILASPNPQPGVGLIHVPIVRRSQSDRVANLPKVVKALQNKYHLRPIIKNGGIMKRDSVAIPLTDEVWRFGPRRKSWN